MKTKAEKVDGGYLLNGTKMWITNVGLLSAIYLGSNVNMKGNGDGRDQTPTP